MRKLLLAIATAFALASCTAAQNAQFQADVVVFNQDVTAINGAIANVSSALAQNCGAIGTIGQALLKFIGTSSHAGQDVAAADAAIVSYCQAVPQNIPQAVAATANAVTAAKVALAAAKAGK